MTSLFSSLSSKSASENTLFSRGPTRPRWLGQILLRRNWVIQWRPPPDWRTQVIYNGGEERRFISEKCVLLSWIIQMEVFNMSIPLQFQGNCLLRKAVWWDQELQNSHWVGLVVRLFRQLLVPRLRMSSQMSSEFAEVTSDNVSVCGRLTGCELNLKPSREKADW